MGLTRATSLSSLTISLSTWVPARASHAKYLASILVASLPTTSSVSDRIRAGLAMLQLVVGTQPLGRTSELILDGFDRILIFSAVFL
jgi:hypothetical protein